MALSVARAAAKALVDAGIPANEIVVVSADRASVDEATRAGHIGVLGDARREEILRDAPRVADAITARWFGGRANLLKA